MWSTFYALDILHLIENHSHQIMEHILLKLDQKEKNQLEQFLREEFDIKLKVSYTVGKWRLIWASYSESFGKIIDKKKTQLRELIWSWCYCVKLMYYPATVKNIFSWFRYFGVCLYHFNLWRSLKPNALLGIHLLWPHSVEQSWWISNASCNVETHENSWQTLRSCWKNCSPSMERERSCS